MCGVDAVYTGAAAPFVSALVAASAAVLVVNHELVTDHGPPELENVPPAACAAEGFTVVAALEKHVLHGRRRDQK